MDLQVRVFNEILQTDHKSFAWKVIKYIIQ